jgi:hypothetical protein
MVDVVFESNDMLKKLKDKLGESILGRELQQTSIIVFSQFVHAE